MDLGRLVPDRVAVAAVEAWLGGRAGESFVFDGFPRTVGQAQALEEVLARYGARLTAALWLELHDEAIAHRVSRRVTCAGLRTQLPDRLARRRPRGRLSGLRRQV